MTMPLTSIKRSRVCPCTSISLNNFLSIGWYWSRWQNFSACSSQMITRPRTPSYRNSFILIIVLPVLSVWATVELVCSTLHCCQDFSLSVFFLEYILPLICRYHNYINIYRPLSVSFSWFYSSECICFL